MARRCPGGRRNRARHAAAKMRLVLRIVRGQPAQPQRREQLGFDQIDDGPRRLAVEQRMGQAADGQHLAGADAAVDPARLVIDIDDVIELAGRRVWEARQESGAALLAPAVTRARAIPSPISLVEPLTIAVRPSGVRSALGSEGDSELAINMWRLLLTVGCRGGSPAPVRLQNRTLAGHLEMPTAYEDDA